MYAHLVTENIYVYATLIFLWKRSLARKKLKTSCSIHGERTCARRRASGASVHAGGADECASGASVRAGGKRYFLL